MTRFNQLSTAIRLSLFVGGAVLAAGPQLAFAQSEGEEAKQLDDIVVTGSRIRSQTVTASSPVTEIGQEQFDLTGATRVDDLVNQYPQLTPAFDSQTNNPSTGYATVSLRNLGAQRTLTLVNGRRLPPGPAGELRDISIIPAAMIRQVDILTGGASAVYGSDAVAGVVNFILDTEFEGFSFSGGYSAYQHDNDNSYMQGLQTARGFTFEDGSSGFDGASRNIDLAWGGTFGDGNGHAAAWLTYRENDPLFHGQRDYASCALNAAGTACGGSGTNAFGNFLIIVPGRPGLQQANLNTNGTWRAGFGPAYNYAPPNFYQRPDERYTAGLSINYDANDYFRPYAELMFVNRNDSVQIAESGTFFAQELTLACNNPLLGTLCRDLNLTPTGGAPLTVYVGRRNVEGGPRRTTTEDSTFRVVAGFTGDLNENWSYDASFLFARTANDLQGQNDFLSSRISDALLGCPDGSFAGCIPYNVWQPGRVTAAAANALAGTSFNKTSTEMQVFNAFLTGDTGYNFPSAEDTISLVAGVESRRERFSFIADNDSTAGNFAGAGAAAPAVNGLTEVNELFSEAQLPIYSGDGLFSSFGLDLGYRLSDYETSGNANTFKVGFGADAGMFRIRGGFNRAIRAPGINNLFGPPTIGLFAGADPCAGATPVFTREQCARTGVTSAQYGFVPASPAGQNNQLAGGDPTLRPEEADTYTLGFVVEPIDDLAISVDYYDIRIEDTVTPIGSPSILRGCALTGAPFLCNRINRNPASGDIWVGTRGFVDNVTDNFGELETRGIDVNVSYGFDALGGRFSAQFLGNYVLEYFQAPVPGAVEFTCEGLINPDCGALQEIRAITSLNYFRDFYSFNLRVRYFGPLEYKDSDGTILFTDRLLFSNGGAPFVPLTTALPNPFRPTSAGGIGSYTYFDLSATATLFGNTNITLGVNNIFDKEPPLVGVDNALNANAPGGYDQLGRFVFANFDVKF